MGYDGGNWDSGGKDPGSLGGRRGTKRGMERNRDCKSVEGGCIRQHWSKGREEKERGEGRREDRDGRETGRTPGRDEGGISAAQAPDPAPAPHSQQRKQNPPSGSPLSLQPRPKCCFCSSPVHVIGLPCP